MTYISAAMIFDSIDINFYIMITNRILFKYSNRTFIAIKYTLNKTVSL